MPNNFQWIAVDAIKPNARSVRTHSNKQICQIADSISTFGFLVPILVDEAGIIIAGYGRCEAVKLRGLRQVTVIEVQGLSEAKRRALAIAIAIADNKIAENAGWDREKLAIELPELSELLVGGILDISIAGFSAPEIDQLTARSRVQRCSSRRHAIHAEAGLTFEELASKRQVALGNER